MFLLLAIAADGKNFLPMIIFKGVPGAKIKNEFYTLPLLINKQIYI